MDRRGSTLYHFSSKRGDVVSGYKKHHGRWKSDKGFTLLELLVVVAMLVLLSAIILSALEGALTNSRDARRLSDMREIEKALVLYYGSNGRFPLSESETVLTGTDPISAALEGDLFITQVPTDPLHNDLTYRYISNSLGTSYTLLFCIEGENVKSFEAGCDNALSP